MKIPVGMLESFVVNLWCFYSYCVAVHCYWGRGRTGTILAACLVALHWTKPEDAIRKVRMKRPYSIETREQEIAIFRFSESLLNKKLQNHNDTANDTCSWFCRMLLKTRVAYVCGAARAGVGLWRTLGVGPGLMTTSSKKLTTFLA